MYVMHFMRRGYVFIKLINCYFLVGAWRLGPGIDLINFIILYRYIYNIYYIIICCIQNVKI